MLGEQGKPAPDSRIKKLSDQLTFIFIEQVEEDIVRLKTRLEHISDKRLRRSVEGSIKREQMRRLVEIKHLLPRSHRPTGAGPVKDGPKAPRSGARWP